jgi:hypothetical protein
MGFGDLRECEHAVDAEACPSRAKECVDVARGSRLRLAREIVAAEKENAGVLKQEWPKWNAWCRSAGGIGSDRTARRQDLDIDANIGVECNLDDMVDAMPGDLAQCRDDVLLGQTVGAYHVVGTRCGGCSHASL